MVGLGHPEPQAGCATLGANRRRRVGGQAGGAGAIVKSINLPRSVQIGCAIFSNTILTLVVQLFLIRQRLISVSS